MGAVLHLMQGECKTKTEVVYITRPIKSRPKERTVFAPSFASITFYGLTPRITGRASGAESMLRNPLRALRLMRLLGGTVTRVADQ